MKAKAVATLVLSLLIIASGCENHKEKKVRVNTAEKKPDSAHNNDNTEKTTSADLPSFVLSCGSGCAMTYTADSIWGHLPDIKVKFNVEMFVDEQLTDTYNEIYVFSYDSSHKISAVHPEGNKDDVLKTLMPNAQQSFREFANELAKNFDKKSFASSKPNHSDT